VGLGRIDDLERAAASATVERVMVTNLRKHRAAIVTEAVALAGHTRAFLKLQEGCDQFCSFCIVPTSRGMSRSVEPRRIVAALDELAARGFKEVTLSGVHLGGYGNDLDPPVALESLLEMIAERSPIERVRLSSLDPEELTDRIIDLVSASPKFCPHFHLPLQAGHDEVLARMRRRYDTAHYRGRVERIVDAMPDAAIGADLIVGFPGETAAQFDASAEFVSSLPLAYLHVFPYSMRSGTTAAKLPAKVATAEVHRRAAEMREVDGRLRRHFMSRFVGSRLNVLLEERGKDGRLRGLSRNYLRVMTDGTDELRNQEVEVEVQLVEGAALSGKIAAAGPTAQAGTAAA
ncbi:MAG: MiaB/RimO family radical SAM methylthiotransferase, partial [Candidatus Binataceae bacterium]